jgi:hypothetical protein
MSIQQNVKVTVTGVHDRACHARDAAGRQVAVPVNSLVAALKGGRPLVGMTLKGTVTDENEKRVPTMVRVDEVEQPLIRIFPAVTVVAVTPQSQYTFLNSEHGAQSVFVPSGARGFQILLDVMSGTSVVIEGYRTVSGKWTALAVTAA